MQNKTNILKDCPFCGATPKIYKARLWYGHYEISIKCEECGCSNDKMSIVIPFDTESLLLQAKNNIINEWNYRYNKKK